MGARNRDAAVAASWQQHYCSLSAPRRSAGTAAAASSCGVAAATATICAAAVTMRSVFPGAAELARAWVVKPTENSARCGHRDDQARKEASQEPARSVPAYLAHHRTASRARLPIFNAYRVKSCIRCGLLDPQTGRAWRRGKPWGQSARARDKRSLIGA